jgi:MFS family permease
MLVARALLGIFEGGAMPGTAFFLSCFYKKTELFFRMAIFIASSALASSFGGLLAAGLSYAVTCSLTKMNTWTK